MCPLPLLAHAGPCGLPTPLLGALLPLESLGWLQLSPLVICALPPGVALLFRRLISGPHSLSMPFAGLFLTSLLPPGFSPQVIWSGRHREAHHKRWDLNPVSQAPQLKWMDRCSFYLPVSQGALQMWESLPGNPAPMLCLSRPVCNL